MNSASFRSRGLTMLVCVLLLGIACRKKSPTGSEPEPIAWTYLFYDDADFENAYDPITHFAEEFQVSDRVQALVLRDVDQGPAGYYQITEDHAFELVKELGEVDMGSGRTLEKFLKWAKENYPSDRTILAFYDHGAAWLGACVDHTDDNMLTMDATQQALKKTGGVDAVFFTAPCLMGALESVYELRDCCELYIGSEYTSGFVAWTPILNDLSLLLHNRPDIGIEALGAQIIDWIEAGFEDSIWTEHMSMTAIKTENIDALAAVMDLAAVKWLENMGDLRTLMTSNAAQLEEVRSYVTGALAFLKASKAVDADFGPLLDQAKAAMADCLIDCCFSITRSKATGLNIYMPNAELGYYTPTYTQCGLDFAEETRWGEMLSRLWSGSAKMLPRVPVDYIPEHIDVETLK